jgi:hypothetical protein
MPPLLLELWREQHPEGHEQTTLNFRTRWPAAEAVPLFIAEKEQLSWGAPLQTLISIVFQLNEAKRCIQDGRLQQLPVALLLLDNAAEIQMDRQRDEPREKIRGQAMRLEAEAKEQGITVPFSSSPEIEKLIEWTTPTCRRSY